MAYTEKDYLTSPATPRPSPFVAMTDAVSHLQKAESIARDLADRIAGSVPRPVEEKSRLAGANGLMDSLDANVAALNEAAGSIISELQRIERRL